MLADRAGLRRLVSIRTATRTRSRSSRCGRGVVVFEATVAADSGGYAQALRLAEQHAPGRRAFAIEGTGSYGAGLTRFLTEPGRAGVRGRPAAARAPLGREDRRAGRGPGGTQRAQPASGRRRRAQAASARRCGR